MLIETDYKMKEQTPYLSVIIPSYKGAPILEKNIPFLLEYLKRQIYSYEVIIVDDGSGDNGETEKTVRKLGCLFFNNPFNEGKGAAVRKGMLLAKGEYRIFTDVDIPFETDAFEIFLHFLDLKQFDMVIGDRTLPGSSYFTEIPFSRKIGSAIFTFIVGRFVTSGMFDTQCGMKGFRKKTAEKIFSLSMINGFAFDVELIYIALKNKWAIKRLPVKLRNQEGSSVNLLKHSPEMLMDLFKIKMNHLRRKYTGSLLIQEEELPLFHPLQEGKSAGNG